MQKSLCWDDCGTHVTILIDNEMGSMLGWMNVTTVMLFLFLGMLILNHIRLNALIISFSLLTILIFIQEESVTALSLKEKRPRQACFAFLIIFILKVNLFCSIWYASFEKCTLKNWEIKFFFFIHFLSMGSSTALWGQATSETSVSALLKETTGGALCSLCTLCTVLCTLHSLHCTLYTVYCTLCNAMYTARYSCTLRCTTMNIVHYAALCWRVNALRSVPCTLRFVPCAVRFVQEDVQWGLFCVQCSLYRLHWGLFRVQWGHRRLQTQLRQLWNRAHSVHTEGSPTIIPYTQWQSY